MASGPGVLQRRTYTWRKGRWEPNDGDLRNNNNDARQLPERGEDGDVFDDETGVITSLPLERRSIADATRRVGQLLGLKRPFAIGGSFAAFLHAQEAGKVARPPRDIDVIVDAEDFAALEKVQAGEKFRRPGSTKPFETTATLWGLKIEVHADGEHGHRLSEEESAGGIEALTTLLSKIRARVRELGALAGASGELGGRFLRMQEDQALLEDMAPADAPVLDDDQHAPLPAAHLTSSQDEPPTWGEDEAKDDAGGHLPLIDTPDWQLALDEMSGSQEGLPSALDSDDGRE